MAQPRSVRPGRALIGRGRLAALISIAISLALPGVAFATALSWSEVATPNTGDPSADNHLKGVAAVSDSDIWAVGGYFNGSAYQTLVEHWNGASWAIVASPNPAGAGANNELFSVAATSSSDGWAVGQQFNGSVNQTLIERWNGATWAAVSSPNPGGAAADNSLYGVTAISSTNAWAVGVYWNGTTDRSFVLHWDGANWTKFTSPNPGTTHGGDYLVGVTATSATNVWAVGSYGPTTGNLRSLVLRWNGVKWAKVKSPKAGGLYSVESLSAVSAVSATDAWAVGGYSPYTGNTTRGLVMHWNGTKWAVVLSPHAAKHPHDTLYGVAAVSASDAWAVGTIWNSSATTDSTVILHWNGTAWSRVASPNPSPTQFGHELDGVVATSATNAWAVGLYSNGTTFRTFAARGH